MEREETIYYIVEEVKGHKAIYGIFLFISICFVLQNLYSFLDLFSYQASKLTLNNLHSILSYAFVHEGLPHLIGNWFGILFFGRLYEKRVGSKNTIVLFLLAILFPPILLFLLYSGFSIGSGPIVGSSAGIMGWAGFLIYDTLFSSEKKLVEKLENLRDYGYEVCVWVFAISFLLCSFILTSLSSWGHALGIGTGMIYYGFLFIISKTTETFTL